KIFFVFLCLILIFLSFYGAFVCSDQAKKAYPNDERDEALIEISERLFSRYFLLAITHIGCIIFLSTILVIEIKNISISNVAKITYEEYKALREAKKAEKQRKKKEKLQKQLEEIEKAE
ncbi:MAG: hypothetical protein IJ012_06525, partial [Clostridia bacterium]|nr:hypothetical protein [Clostridia bacterium]